MQQTSFPDFYAECAWLDGHRDAERGTDSTASYMRLGKPEPYGMSWYALGRKAQANGVVRHA